MREYPNFYENLKEAQARLGRTIVLYDGLPFHVLAITNHKDDGIFRVWMEPLGLERTKTVKDFYLTTAHYGDQHGIGDQLDLKLAADPDCGVLRKHMNSPKFNRFRPFPLGMCNFGTQVFYVERQPVRPAMTQGLTKGGCFETLITAGSRQDNPRRVAEVLDINSGQFRDCILGQHYEPREALAALLNPLIANDALAFHREFALVRGPLDMIFLAYRSDIIGILPKSDFDLVRLGKEFKYCKEVVGELNLFRNIG